MRVDVAQLQTLLFSCTATCSNHFLGGVSDTWLTSAPKQHAPDTSIYGFCTGLVQSHTAFHFNPLQTSANDPGVVGRCCPVDWRLISSLRGIRHTNARRFVGNRWTFLSSFRVWQNRSERAVEVSKTRR